MERFYSPNDPRFSANDDASTIQNAVDAAVADGVRVVRIPRQCARTGLDFWQISRAILLPGNITVYLDDCHLILNEGIYDNIFRNANMYTNIARKPEGLQKGIRIIGTGEAILDGGKGNDLRETNSGKDGKPDIRFNNLIFLQNVCNIVLENFQLHNMRHWGMNFVGCRGAKIANIYFQNGDHIPNQDGIDLRIGCSEFIIENITGRTGDDVVALTALPLGGDKYYLPEDILPDIHDIIIRNVQANTRQTMVALRNCDGAKIYNVTIENICDVGGGYEPGAILRIGENNYYQKRPCIMGELYNIRAQGLTSHQGGTVFLGGALRDSSVRNIHAGGTTMSAVSTFAITCISGTTGKAVEGGVSMENVVFDNIIYRGTAEHGDETRFNIPGTPFPGCALDFRCLRQSDIFKNVVFSNIFTPEDTQLALVKDGFHLDIRN